MICWYVRRNAVQMFQLKSKITNCLSTATLCGGWHSKDIRKVISQGRHTHTSTKTMNHNVKHCISVKHGNYRKINVVLCFEYSYSISKFCKSGKEISHLRFNLGLFIYLVCLWLLFDLLLKRRGTKIPNLMVSSTKSF